ncbi:MAG: hypothetical protein UH080_06970 [Ruminococcus sp.]|nr:hypothetical protein [Ruminococcus sp.]
MKKRVLSALLCATLAVTGMASANAAEVKEHKGFKDLGEEIYLENNTVTGFVYNVEEDYDVRFRLYGEEDRPNLIEPNYILYLKGDHNVPSSVTLDEVEGYCLGFGLRGGYTANQSLYNFGNTGGKYKKIRIKLSEFSDYFNEDGAYTRELGGENIVIGFTKQGDDTYYSSCLGILSGGVANGVVPDENGEVEIFVSTNIRDRTRFFTYGLMQQSDQGGFNKLSFGNVDCTDWVDVNDVTTLQLYLAGAKELDTLGLFHADVNCDDVCDVNDVTALQFGIAGIYK